MPAAPSAGEAGARVLHRQLERGRDRLCSDRYRARPPGCSAPRCRPASAPRASFGEHVGAGVLPGRSPPGRLRPRIVGAQIRARCTASATGIDRVSARHRASTCESSKRSSTIATSVWIERSISAEYPRTIPGSSTTPSSIASTIARRLASGVRRSWEIEVIRSRRAASVRRSVSISVGDPLPPPGRARRRPAAARGSARSSPTRASSSFSPSRGTLVSRAARAWWSDRRSARLPRRPRGSRRPPDHSACGRGVDQHEVVEQRPDRPR